MGLQRPFSVMEISEFLVGAFQSVTEFICACTDLQIGQREPIISLRSDAIPAQAFMLNAHDFEPQLSFDREMVGVYRKFD